MIIKASMLLPGDAVLFNVQSYWARNIERDGEVGIALGGRFILSKSGLTKLLGRHTVGVISEVER